MINQELITSAEKWVSDQYQRSTQLPYHNLAHSLYVRDACVRLAREEACALEEYFLLSLAALFHDIGHLDDSAKHEERSVHIATQYLGDQGLNPSDIESVQRLIWATRYGTSSHDKLESIIKDADLYYLGTDDYFPQSKAYRAELATAEGQVFDEPAWIALQIKFLQEHKYHLRESMQHLEPIKQNHIKLLKDEIRSSH